MATVGEGIALSTLLMWILQEDPYGNGIPSAEQALKAAKVLVKRQERCGTCFYNEGLLEKRWGRKAPCVITKGVCSEELERM